MTKEQRRQDYGFGSMTKEHAYRTDTTGRKGSLLTRVEAVSGSAASVVNSK